MKNVGIFLVISAVVGTILLGIEVGSGIVTTSEFADQSTLFTEDLERPSVTFILGRDKGDQKYFQLAERHFLRHPIEKTDQVIRHVSSLQSLIEYLNENSQLRPWGIIHVVVHGNVWSGLSVPMWPEGPRSYPKDLLKAIKKGKFSQLRSGVVDEDSKINFWACGIGKNPFLKLALERLFESEDGIQPSVYASPHFVIFKDDPNGVPQRLKASYWPYFFKRGYRPSISEIAHDYQERFPDQDINWQSALIQEATDVDTGVFHHSFHVPVVWTVYYDHKDDRPSVGTEIERMAWINSQPELLQKIKEMEIPMEKYHWTVNKVLIKDKEGNHQPAIKAIGMSTIICVMQPESEFEPNPFL